MLMYKRSLYINNYIAPVQFSFYIFFRNFSKDAVSKFFLAPTPKSRCVNAPSIAVQKKLQ